MKAEVSDDSGYVCSFIPLCKSLECPVLYILHTLYMIIIIMYNVCNIQSTKNSRVSSVSDVQKTPNLQLMTHYDVSDVQRTPLICN